MALGPGQVIAGWRLLRRLGEGAQSQVWLAGRPAAAPSELVALKLVPLQAPDDPAAPTDPQVLQAQAAVAASLQHPGIVRVLGAGIDAGLAWLAMEPVPGTDLVRYTHPRRRLPDAVVLHLLQRVAEALAHAHARGVVHRDIKPANVIVDWAGDAVKVVDFGLARTAGASRTGTGVVAGSPAYMAPELLAGAEPDARTDLYALGVLAFELLTGTRPHDGGGDTPSFGQLLARVAREPAPALGARRPPGEPVAPALEALVARLLAKPRAERAADAAAVAAELQALHAASRPGSRSRGTGSRAVPPPGGAGTIPPPQNR